MKEGLKELKKLFNSIAKKEERLQYLDSQRKKMTSTITGMPHGSSSKDFNIDYILLEQELTKDREKLINLLREITPILKEVPEPYKQILEFHYIDNLTIMEIYMLPTNNYSYETIKSYNKRGIRLYNEICKNKSLSTFVHPLSWYNVGG